MKSIKVCEYSRSRSFHYDLILQDHASGERSQDQWSSGLEICTELLSRDTNMYMWRVRLGSVKWDFQFSHNTKNLIILK